MATEPNYFFRDDLEAEKDRQAQVGPVTLAPAAPAAPAAPKAPGATGGNAFADLGKVMATTAAPKTTSAKPDYFADFRAALAAQDPFKQQIQGAVQDTLKNPTAAFDAAASAQGDKLGREIGAEAERRRQEAVLTYGGNTGQAARSQDAFRNAALMRQAEFGRDVSAGRAQAAEQARAGAVQQGAGLLGQDQQAAAQLASLGFQREGMAQDAALTREGYGLQREMGAADRASREALTREGYQVQQQEGAAERSSREGVAFAGLSLEEKRLAQEGMQFASKLDFDKSALAAQMDEAARARVWQAIENEKSRGSQEKIAFAGLDLDRQKFQAADANAKQGLSLEASAQAMTRLGMDREEAFQYASLAQAKGLAEKGLSLQQSEQELQRLGMSQEDSRYYAGLAQQERLAGQEIASREKLAFAQIGSQERLDASRQVFEAAQNNLNRSLEQLLSNDRIGAQLKLTEMDQALQERLQANSFVQDKDLEAMRADLQKSLQERGIQADTAKQIADQKFQEMTAQKEQAFEIQMNDIRQKFVTGERVDSQAWEGAMKTQEMRHDEIMAKLNSTLRLDEAQNAQAFQTAFQQMQNDFTTLRDERGYSQEEAMQRSQQAFQEQLTRAGFTHEEAMQGAQLAAQASENQKSRASQEMMAAATLAKQDKQFYAELQQRYLFNDQDIKLRTKELTGQLELMGLQGEQLRGAIANQKVSSAMEIAALGMEIGNGSPEAMAPFVEQFGAALEGYMKGQGINISQSDFVKAMTAKGGTAGGAGGAPAGPAAGTGDALRAAKDKLNDALGTLPAKATQNQAAIKEALGIATGAARPKSLNSFSEAQIDRLAYKNILDNGVPEKTAADLLITAIGLDRFKAAHKAKTGKDWA